MGCLLGVEGGSQHHAASCGNPFHDRPYRDGCSVADAGMQTLPIVEHLDVESNTAALAASRVENQQ